MFSVPNLGAILRLFNDAGPLQTAYARVRRTSGDLPGGLLMVERRQSDVVVNTFAAPAAPLLVSSRTYVEVSVDALVSTALSFTNPNAEEATVNFELRSADGNISRSGAFTLAAEAALCDPDNLCNQLSRFANEFPFSSGLGFDGTITIASTQPIAFAATRVVRDVMTSQPVADLTVSATNQVQALPHFAVGNGMRTQLLLVNTTGRDLRGKAEFVDAAGLSVSVKHDTEYGDTIPYSIPPNGALKFVLGDSDNPVSGSIWIVPTDADPAPQSFVTLSYAPSGVVVAEADIVPTMGAAFRLFAQTDPPNLDTVVALANPTTEDGTVYFSATDLSGELVGSASASIPAKGKIMGPLGSLIPALSDTSFVGLIRITTDVSRIAVTEFRERLNEGQLDLNFLFTSLVPTLENDVSSEQLLILPNIHTGDGYMAETVFYSGTAGPSPQGTLVFIGPDGMRIELPGL
jgi:hypothetical protein